MRRDREGSRASLDAGSGRKLCRASFDDQLGLGREDSDCPSRLRDSVLDVIRGTCLGKVTRLLYTVWCKALHRVQARVRNRQERPPERARSTLRDSV